MGKNDIILLSVLLVPVLILVVLAGLFPIYRMQDGTYERHFVGNPPTWEFGGNLRRLPAEEIEKRLQDPAQREFVERNLETQVFHPDPVFIGPVRGNLPGKNGLGAAAFYAVLMYVVIAIFKWVNRG
ncbi:MAG: hypothetical protein AAF456_08555 [Planctomycetota bacterium]